MSETATPPAARKRRTKSEGSTPKRTQFHILRRIPPVIEVEEESGDEEVITPERWEIVATLTASSGETARRTYFQKAAEQQRDAGTVGSFREELVAVPTRSWKPKPMGVELHMRIVIG